MNKPWLIQRFKETKDREPVFLQSWANNKTLNEVEEESFKGLNFDYMGSAEFEFGEIPKAFKKIINESDTFEHFDILITNNEKTNFVRVMGFCKIGEQDDVIQILNEFAEGKESLKERTNFKSSLFGDKRLNNRAPSKNGKAGRILKIPRVELVKSDTTGWLDIENLWFATTEEKKYEYFATLLNLQITQIPLPKVENMAINKFAL